MAATPRSSAAVTLQLGTACTQRSLGALSELQRLPGRHEHALCVCVCGVCVCVYSSCLSLPFTAFPNADCSFSLPSKQFAVDRWMPSKSSRNSSVH